MKSKKLFTLGLAVWADGGYSYALSLAPGVPLPEWLDMLSPGEVS